MKIIETLNKYKELLDTPLGTFQFVAMMIVLLSVLAIFISVAINFSAVDNTRKAIREKKSIVETGTMTLFFFVFYLVIKFGIGVLEGKFSLYIPIICIGLILIVVGTIVNIAGRFSLGKNWANQIKVYSNHSLVTTGVYRFVRHPLYASLIWMFFGGSFVYANYIAFLLNLFVFIPFMYYRAKQEEAILVARFEEYSAYQKNTGMFFPKI